MGKKVTHVLVPKHELLSEKEVNKLITDYNIIKEQLPSIMLNDPALSELEVKAGDVVKITRENPITGTSYAYRLIVNP